jgi:O-methyltransferase
MIGRILNSLERRRRDARHRALYAKYREHTMISPERHKSNLEIIERFTGIEGAVVECGVWRGGMMASMAEILGDGRSYYLFDSFEGLPPAGEFDGEKAKEYQSDVNAPDYFDNCAAEMSFAEKAMKMADASDVHFIKGWFDQTTGTTPIMNRGNGVVSAGSGGEIIAVLRLDGDWYESTKVCLDNLFDKVAPGGVVIFDDYDYWEGCTRAVHDFLSERKLPIRVREWMSSGVHYIVN